MAGPGNSPLTDRQQAAGLMYTVFSLFFLPILLPVINAGFPRPLNSAWVNFIYFCLNFLCLTFLLRSFLRKQLIYAGKHIGQILGFCVLGFGLYYIASTVLSVGIVSLYPEFSNMNDSSIADRFSESYWIMAIGTVLLVPVAEELMHRALIFGSLRKSHPIAAYPVSMVFFSAVHVMGYVGAVPAETIVLSFLQYLPAGWVLAWCYRKSGCIFVPILIHTAINAMGLLSLR